MKSYLSYLPIAKCKSPCHMKFIHIQTLQYRYSEDTDIFRGPKIILCLSVGTTDI